MVTGSILRHTLRMDEPLAPVRSSALTRATDGRSGSTFLDPRAWRDAITLQAAPAWAVIGFCITASVLGVLNAMRGGVPWDWGLSAQALAEGRWYALVAHMFAHAGPWHLYLNATFLLGVTPVVMARFGLGPSGWLRFAILFLVSGLLGAALYLALHPAGVVPMVGASGAICGLWGAATRFDPEDGMAALTSARVRDQVMAFAKMNVILFLILFALVWLSGGVGGLAWEAHLGGFLFGLLVGPRLASRTVPAAFAAG